VLQGYEISACAPDSIAGKVAAISQRAQQDMTRHVVIRHSPLALEIVQSGVEFGVY
jgi:hypothetical protein